MSDRDKTLAEQIAALPPKLQERFLDQVHGAAIALDLLEERRDISHDAERSDVPQRP